MARDKKSKKKWFVVVVMNIKHFEDVRNDPTGIGIGLKNILYNKVLANWLMEGAISISYADDLAVIIEATDTRKLEHRGSESLRAIKIWMKRNHFTLATENTEVVLS